LGYFPEIEDATAGGNAKKNPLHNKSPTCPFPLKTKETNHKKKGAPMVVQKNVAVGLKGEKKQYGYSEAIFSVESGTVSLGVSTSALTPST